MRKFSLIIGWTSVIVIIVGILHSFGVIPHRRYFDADFQIETYRSQHDEDGDGIDDQTDILQSTWAYLDTQPKYQSKYYAGGYPDDDHGVCTDVVAQGLKGAGYDLMQLVDEDIQHSPEAYDVEIREIGRAHV